MYLFRELEGNYITPIVQNFCSSSRRYGRYVVNMCLLLQRRRRTKGQAGWVYYFLEVP